MKDDSYKGQVIRKLLDVTIKDLSDGQSNISDLSESQVAALTLALERAANIEAFKLLPGGLAGTSLDFHGPGLG